MADRYVYSGAAGAGTGADWANAHTTLAAAITAGAIGDVYFVAHDHAESQGTTLTLTFKGTSSTPDRVLCVNRAGSVPPVAADLTTGATVTTTASVSISVSGVAHIHGIAFRPGSGATGTASVTFGGSASSKLTLDSCTFALLSTGASSRVSMCATAGAKVTFLRCQMSFGHISQGVTGGSGWSRWYGFGVPIATGAIVPTNLVANQSDTASWGFYSTDLSFFGSSSNLVGANMEPTEPARFVNCRLDSNVAVTAGITNGSNKGDILVIGCHSAGNVARNERHAYQARLTTETTIVRTGGASDGTTPVSWKILADSDNERDHPFETFEGEIWNADTGSAKTLTIHTVTDNITLTDAEIWLEVEYLDNASYPLRGIVSDAPATILTAAANQATSTETWTTTGLTTPVKQKLEVTFTPQMAGTIRWKVKFARTSGTVYVCPKPELS